MSQEAELLGVAGKRPSSRKRTAEARAAKNKRAVRIALLRLLFFTIVVAVLPLGIVGAAMIAKDGWEVFSVHNVWQRGELALLAVALVADGCGILFPGKESQPLRRVTLGGAAFIVAIVSVAWFVLAQISDVEPRTNTGFSLLFFVSGVIIAGACRVVAEAEQ